MNTVNIAGLDKAVLLVALYNASQQQGLGFLNPAGCQSLALADARAALAQSSYFDYLNGRVMKVELSGDELNTWAYNRDNGPGAAEAVVTSLRTSAPFAAEPTAAHP